MKLENLQFLPIPGKFIYVATDFHLGSPDWKSSLGRETKLVEWLTHVAPTAQAVVLLGDTFDFWFEYRQVVPKGYIRLLAAFIELRSAAIPVYLFTGNHDMWMFGYLEEACGVKILRKPTQFLLGTKTYLLGHGDGLGPGQHIYKFQKWFFDSQVCQRLFALVHPDIGISFARAWSGQSRKANASQDVAFKGNEEYIWAWCKALEQTTHHDCYVFGHRHLPLCLPVGTQSHYLNLGDWFADNAYYGQLSAGGVQLFYANHQAIDLELPPFGQVQI